MPDLIGLPGIVQDTVIHMAVGIGKEEDFSHQLRKMKYKDRKQFTLPITRF
jgi:hypothetical protein